jgi:hypothetical protein
MVRARGAGMRLSEKFARAQLTWGDSFITAIA